MTDKNTQLTKRSIRAGAWLGGYRVYARGINFLKTPVLTRIFLPSQLGIFGVVSIALNLLETFAETGLEHALIQKKKVSSELISTAWYLNLIRSLLISLLLIIVAPFVGSYFNSPESVFMMMAISVVPILRSLRNPQIILLKRKLEFGKETIMLSIGSTAEVITVLAISLIWRNVWALTIAIIVGALSELIASYIFFEKPKFKKPKWNSAKGLLNFGKWVWSSSSLSFLSNQGDDIFVAKILGTGPLALYQYAYKIASLPATQIAGTVSQVTFPAFSSIQSDKSRLKRAFMKSFGFITLTTIPPLIIVFLIPEIIVRILFGENWIGAAPALRILSLYGILRSYANIMGPLANALGKPQYITYNSLIRTVVLFILIAPFTLKAGIVGASWATVIAIAVANLTLLINIAKHFYD